MEYLLYTSFSLDHEIIDDLPPSPWTLPLILTIMRPPNLHYEHAFLANRARRSVTRPCRYAIAVLGMTFIATVSCKRFS